MPRKLRPQLCECGCGKMTKGCGKWVTGHNTAMLAEIVYEAGGTIALRKILDQHIARQRRSNT